MTVYEDIFNAVKALPIRQRRGLLFLDRRLRDCLEIYMADSCGIKSDCRDILGMSVVVRSYVVGGWRIVPVIDTNEPKR